MSSLIQYGWNNYIQRNTIQTPEQLVAGRVISIQGFKHHVVTSKGEIEAELSGKLLYGASVEELPKPGDWVHLTEYDTMGYIVEVLPRKNELARKTPGQKTARQILATNVDCALVVQGLDRDFNLMRLERYLVQLAACNVKAIVILNKADLVTNQEEHLAEIQKLQRDTPVYFCSTLNGNGIAQLNDEVLEPYKTYVLIGSSGVGKSSLLNALMNEDVQKTNATSDANRKGRHTTTTRDLFQLPNGSLVIDTPGMREFGLTSGDEQDSGDMFPAIAAFAEHCRFSDCKHIQEAGCAVLDAVANGELDKDVYDSYVKLMKEQRRFEINAEDRKKLSRQAGKMGREAKKHRDRYKGG